MPKFADIIVVKRDGTDGHKFPMTQKQVSFGSGSEEDIQVKLADVPDRVCRIESQNGKAVRLIMSQIEPNCPHGTVALNGKAIQASQKPIQLSHLDTLTIGSGTTVGVGPDENARQFRIELPDKTTTAAKQRKTPRKITILQDENNVNAGGTTKLKSKLTKPKTTTKSSKLTTSKSEANKENDERNPPSCSSSAAAIPGGNHDKTKKQMIPESVISGTEAEIGMKQEAENNAVTLVLSHLPVLAPVQTASAKPAAAERGRKKKKVKAETVKTKQKTMPASTSNNPQSVIINKKAASAVTGKKGSMMGTLNPGEGASLSNPFGTPSDDSAASATGSLVRKVIPAAKADHAPKAVDNPMTADDNPKTAAEINESAASSSSEMREQSSGSDPRHRSCIDQDDENRLQDIIDEELKHDSKSPAKQQQPRRPSKPLSPSPNRYSLSPEPATTGKGVKQAAKKKTKSPSTTSRKIVVSSMKETMKSAASDEMKSMETAATSKRDSRSGHVDAEEFTLVLSDEENEHFEEPNNILSEQLVAEDDGLNPSRAADNGPVSLPSIQTTESPELGEPTFSLADQILLAQNKKLKKFPLKAPKSSGKSSTVKQQSKKMTSKKMESPESIPTSAAPTVISSAKNGKTPSTTKKVSPLKTHLQKCKTSKPRESKKTSKGSVKSVKSQLFGSAPTTAAESLQATQAGSSKQSQQHLTDEMQDTEKVKPPAKSGPKRRRTKNKQTFGLTELFASPPASKVKSSPDAAADGTTSSAPMPQKTLPSPTVLGSPIEPVDSRQRTAGASEERISDSTGDEGTLVYSPGDQMTTIDLTPSSLRFTTSQTFYAMSPAESQQQSSTTLVFIEDVIEMQEMNEKELQPHPVQNNHSNSFPVAAAETPFANATPNQINPLPKKVIKRRNRTSKKAVVTPKQSPSPKKQSVTPKQSPSAEKQSVTPKQSPSAKKSIPPKQSPSAKKSVPPKQSLSAKKSVPPKQSPSAKKSVTHKQSPSAKKSVTHKQSPSAQKSVTPKRQSFCNASSPQTTPKSAKKSSPSSSKAGSRASSASPTGSVKNALVDLLNQIEVHAVHAEQSPLRKKSTQSTLSTQASPSTKCRRLSIDETAHETPTKSGKPAERVVGKSVSDLKKGRTMTAAAEWTKTPLPSLFSSPYAAASKTVKQSVTGSLPTLKSASAPKRVAFSPRVKVTPVRKIGKFNFTEYFDSRKPPGAEPMINLNDSDPPFEMTEEIMSPLPTDHIRDGPDSSFASSSDNDGDADRFFFSPNGKSDDHDGGLAKSGTSTQKSSLHDGNKRSPEQQLSAEEEPERASRNTSPKKTANTLRNLSPKKPASPKRNLSPKTSVSQERSSSLKKAAAKTSKKSPSPTKPASPKRSSSPKTSGSRSSNESKKTAAKTSKKRSSPAASPKQRTSPKNSDTSEPDSALNRSPSPRKPKKASTEQGSPKTKKALTTPKRSRSPKNPAPGSPKTSTATPEQKNPSPLKTQKSPKQRQSPSPNNKSGSQKRSPSSSSKKAPASPQPGVASPNKPVTPKRAAVSSPKTSETTTTTPKRKASPKKAATETSSSPKKAPDASVQQLQFPTKEAPVSRRSPPRAKTAVTPRKANQNQNNSVPEECPLLDVLARSQSPRKSVDPANNPRKRSVSSNSAPPKLDSSRLVNSPNGKMSPKNVSRATKRSSTKSPEAVRRVKKISFSPKSSLTSPQLVGVKDLFHEVRPANSPALSGLRDLFRMATTSNSSSPQELGGLKELLSTPTKQSSDENFGETVKSQKRQAGKRSPSLAGVQKSPKAARGKVTFETTPVTENEGHPNSLLAADQSATVQITRLVSPPPKRRVTRKSSASSKKTTPESSKPKASSESPKKRQTRDSYFFCFDTTNTTKKSTPATKQRRRRSSTGSPTDSSIGGIISSPTITSILIGDQTAEFVVTTVVQDSSHGLRQQPTDDTVEKNEVTAKPRAPRGRPSATTTTTEAAGKTGLEKATPAPAKTPAKRGRKPANVQSKCLTEPPKRRGSHKETEKEQKPDQPEKSEQVVPKKRARNYSAKASATTTTAVKEPLNFSREPSSASPSTSATPVVKRGRPPKKKVAILSEAIETIDEAAGRPEKPPETDSPQPASASGPAKKSVKKTKKESSKEPSDPSATPVAAKRGRPPKKKAVIMSEAEAIDDEAVVGTPEKAPKTPGRRKRPPKTPAAASSTTGKKEDTNAAKQATKTKNTTPKPTTATKKKVIEGGTGTATAAKKKAVSRKLTAAESTINCSSPPTTTTTTTRTTRSKGGGGWAKN